MVALGLNLSLVLLTGALLADAALHLGTLAARVPAAILIPTLLLLIVQFGRAVLRGSSLPTTLQPLTARDALGPIFWLMVLLAGVLLAGLAVGVGAFLLTWLVARARLNWWRAVGTASIVALLIAWGLPLVTTARLPQGLLFLGLEF